MKFRGKWIKDLYRTENFAVALFENKSDGETYKCVGTTVPHIKNVTLGITAEEEEDTKYGGNRYRIISYEISKCEDEAEIIDFLSSGMFPGIGKAMAQRIYRKFKNESINIIEKDPSQLAQVKGISSAKVNKIIANYKINKAETELYKYLSVFGFTVNQVHKIKEISGTKDIAEFAKLSPYSLIKIRGVTFEMADTVAEDNLIPKDDINRVEAAVVQIIKNTMVSGHVGCDYMPLAAEAIKMLKTEKINASNIKAFLLELINRGKLGYRKVKTNGGEQLFYIYLPNVLKAENDLAENIKRCVESNHKTEVKDIDKEIRFAETRAGIILDEGQKKAIRMALSNNFSVITGGPGTGKTTIINVLCDIWEKNVKNKSITLMSPTGRAARRMAEATGRWAATIHSTLQFGVSDDSGTRREMSEDNIIKDSLVVIDESSMIDLFLARDMMDHLVNCTIVLVGDADQLPSVGCGKVLDDIISSGTVPVTRLKYSHRQQEGSSICENADRIKKGYAKLTTNRDFSMYLCKEDNNRYDYSILEKLEDKMVDEYLKLVDEYGLKNVAALCPFNKKPAGQISMNTRLQGILNPYNGTKEFKASTGTVFRTGDPVMQLVNRDGVSNGDIGEVIAVDRVDGKDTLVVKYYDQLITYTKDDSDEIALAYAMTVHKSQGSEYDAVVTCLVDEHGPMIRRNILYTALTRAKKRVVLCGSGSAIRKAVANNSTEERNSLLKYNLRNILPCKDKLIEFKKANEQLTLSSVGKGAL